MPSSASKPRISLRGLRTFCVAARYQSFRAAGEVLYITSSAVSHQIKGLEQELGQKLFERNSRELVLTDIGRSLFDEIDPLVERLDDVASSYKAGEKSSSIRLSVQPFFASEFFVPRLSEFTAEHPEIDIRVGTSDESAEKHPAHADLSVRLFRTPPSDMRSNLLFPLRMVPTGSPEFKKNMRVRKKKIESEFPLIVYETHPKAWSQWSDESGVELPEKTKTTRLDSMIAVVRAAERGIGAAMVPVPLADLWFKQGSIVRLFKQELVTDLSYFLIFHEDKMKDDNLCMLRDWILQNFADAT
ncbi:MAG: LysR family transcriptional regulator [Gammaproteobacteria bacterium]|nr:LysR family transcriptional regulator [Gammaproteobacteria bacterium]